MNWYKISQESYPVFSDEQKRDILWVYYDGKLIIHESEEYTVHPRAFPQLDTNKVYRGRFMGREKAGKIISIIPPWEKSQYRIPDKLISLLRKKFGYDVIVDNIN